jgi:hypothetical protein
VALAFAARQVTAGGAIARIASVYFNAALWHRGVPARPALVPRALAAARAPEVV